MITSILSLLLLILPGYSLLSINRIHKRIGLKGLDRILFGSVSWIFYLVATILTIKMLVPSWVSYALWFNYALGSLLTGYWFLTRLPYLLTLHISTLKLYMCDIVLGGALPFLVPIISFIVLITLYSPLIDQYDALSLYLPIARQITGTLPPIANFWPTFGDAMPVLPIIYSWFYHLSNTPLLRLIPLYFLSLSLIVVFAIGRHLASKNIYIAYTSVVSFVSMIALHQTMWNYSLYLDLAFMMFISISFYALFNIMISQPKSAIYFLLGMSLTLTILSKELGIFYAWFVIIMLYYSSIKRFENRLWRALLGIFLLLPFMIFHFGSMLIFNYYESQIGELLLSITNYRSFLMIIFMIIFLFISIKDSLQFRACKLSSLLVLVTFLTPALFFMQNLFSLGTPMGNFQEPYIQSLYENGIIFPTGSPIVSFNVLYNFFFSNALITVNIVPILVTLMSLFLLRSRNLRGWGLSYLILWFFYSLFIFLFIQFGRFEGSDVRYLLPIAIPVSLVVGVGVHFLVDWLGNMPNWMGTTIYTFISSMFLGYFWMLKSGASAGWMTNLYLFITSYSIARTEEVLVFAAPWVLLIMIVLGNKKIHINRLIIFPKNFWFNVGILLVLISAAIPMQIFTQSLKHVNTLNFSYYDQPASFGDNWFDPILNFYKSDLNEDKAVTIGFGITPLEYFLERPFLDLGHSRNWLLLLPLLQSMGEAELVSYLKQLNACYFLIPTTVYGMRDRYEAAAKNSTLFKFIESEAIVSVGGQRLQFKKLASFIPLTLYTLRSLPSTTAVDMTSGVYSLDNEYDAYSIHNDKDLEHRIALWKINNTVLGCRCLLHVGETSRPSPTK